MPRQFENAVLDKYRTGQNEGRVNAAMEALDLICGDRALDYGSATDNFKRIAKRWSQFFGREVETYEVCLMMIDLKVSRLINEYKRDSAIDIIGYACLLCELADEKSDERNSNHNKKN